EEEREDEREHDRERGHVEQLHGDVADLAHGPPREREGGGPPAGPRRAGVGGERCPQRGGVDRPLEGGADIRGGHAASSSSSACGSAGWPVRDRNTSSRLGWAGGGSFSG